MPKKKKKEYDFVIGMYGVRAKNKTEAKQKLKKQLIKEALDDYKRQVKIRVEYARF